MCIHVRRCAFMCVDVHSCAFMCRCVHLCAFVSRASFVSTSLTPIIIFCEPLEWMKNKSDNLVDNADNNIVDHVIIDLFLLCNYFLLNINFKLFLEYICRNGFVILLWQLF